MDRLFCFGGPPGGQLFAATGVGVRLGGTWARDVSLLFVAGIALEAFCSGMDLKNRVEGLEGDGSRWN